MMADIWAPSLYDLYDPRNHQQCNYQQLAYQQQCMNLPSIPLVDATYDTGNSITTKQSILLCEDEEL